MLVSWGGFKKTVKDEIANHFFKVRLWTHKEIIDEFLHHYTDLPGDVREWIEFHKGTFIECLQFIEDGKGFLSG